MKQEKPKMTRADKSRRVMQIVCLIMAALMLLGVIAAILPYSAMRAYALDEGAVTTAETERMEEESKEPENRLLLRIGLMYGSGVTPSYTIKAALGFSFGSVDAKTNEFSSFWDVPEKTVVVCQDANLTNNSDEEPFIPGSQGVVIGGYHLELPTAYHTKEDIKKAVETVNAALTAAGIRSSLIYAYPAMKNGALYIRIGDFGSSDSASNKSTLIKGATGETPVVITPNTNALTVLSPVSNLILFEYLGTGASLGITALCDTGGTAQDITTPVGNTYAGVFRFDRYGDGISVINILPLEDYVAGVVPYEINNNWKPECLKAFSVLVRSYALANLNKHKAYGFDLCSGTECQAYRGTKSQNEAVKKAVADTAGLVVTYNGSICSTIYSAVTGGCTVNCEQIWNGSAYPYLRAVETPWEDYASHPNGVWTKQYTPTELYYRLVSMGYTQLKGAIADAEVLELAENSTYIYRLRFTDIYGVSVTLKGTDIIRTTLGLNSANFVIGHNGRIPLLDEPLTVLTADGEKALETDEKSEGDEEGEKTVKTTKILTADGIVEIPVSEGLTVLTADGEKTMSETDYDISDADRALLRSGTTSFIFIGKGWGHGGGFSQWGMKNLAEQGSDCDTILNAYLTNAEIRHYSAVLK